MKKTRSRRDSLTFAERHDAQTAEAISSQVTSISLQLKGHALVNKWVLHPEKSRALSRWDSITGVALLYTASVTPFETAFMPSVLGTAAWLDPWFLVNRLLDIIFSIDLVLQFFLAFQTGNNFGGFTWEFNHRKIVRHYLTTWFSVDLFTVFVPGGIDLYTASGAFDSTEGASSMAENLSMLRVLRVIRLVKLIRLVRASRLFQRWQAKITLTYGTQIVISCVTLLLCSAHWYACIISLTAALHPRVDDTWLGGQLYGLCKPGDAEGDGPLAGCRSLSLGSWYLAAFAWSVMIITGTGGTDFYPSSASDGETVVVTVLVLWAAFLWTYVLAAFCDVATNGDPALTAFRQRLDGLNAYITFNGVPSEMAGRMRSYMNQQRGMQLRQELGQRALPNLSLALQMEVIQFVNRRWLENVWFIRNLDAPVKVRLAMAMQPKVLAPGEVAPNRNLYNLTRGTMTQGGRVLSKGSVWGDDIILENPRHAFPHLARAITYADVMYFSRQTFLDTVATYPSSMHSLRRNQAFLALRRALIAAVRGHRNEILTDQMISRLGEMARIRSQRPNDFLDRVDTAAASLSSGTQQQSVDLAIEDSAKAQPSSRPGVSPSPPTMLQQSESRRMEEKIEGLCSEMKELKALVHSLVAGLGTTHRATHYPHDPTVAAHDAATVHPQSSGLVEREDRTYGPPTVV